MDQKLSTSTLKKVLKAQINELTEHRIYANLAKVLQKKDPENAKILEQISHDEIRHHDIWQKYSGQEVKASSAKIFFFVWIARIFGLTFGLKLMENGEELAQSDYTAMTQEIPEAMNIAEDEDRHEQSLIALIQEERLEYIGSIVLGLNDALVELTGALAGLSFALQNSRMTALAGLITGIAASFSMAASEYLSNRAKGESKNALKSSLYTGTAYIITVILLILPFFLLPSYVIALPVTLGIALTIIFVFNFYISVAKDYVFWKRFSEMALISLGVAALSFGIGVLVRKFLGVDV